MGSIYNVIFLKEKRYFMNYTKTAKKILSVVGGTENINEVTLCSGRIRMKIAEPKLVEESKLHEIGELIGFMNQQDEIQFVLGNNSRYLFQAIIAEGHMKGNVQEEKGQKNWLERTFLYLSDIVMPVLPLLVGAGFLKIVLAILLYFNAMSTEGMLYLYINYLADLILCFFPFAIGVSACYRMKGNPFYSILIVGVLFQPYIYERIQMGTIPLLQVPIQMAQCSVGVIPIIVAIWITNQCNHVIRKGVPSERMHYIRPVLTMGIAVTVVLLIIGPFSTLLNNVITTGFVIILYVARWATPVIVGIFAPVLLLLGVLYGQLPFGAVLIATSGFDQAMGPGLFLFCISQGVAAICVGVNAKENRLKRLSFVSGALALFGISEPAMLGVTMRYQKPFYAALLGSIAGGLYYGITGVARFGQGLPGILTLLTYQSIQSPWNLVNCIIGAVITVVVTSVLTYVWGLEYIYEEQLQPIKEYKIQIHDQARKHEYVNQIKQFQEMKGIPIYAPVSGRTIPLQHVNDSIYANEMMGKGVAIIPTEGEIRSPVDGRVIILFDSLQGIGIKGEDGSELFIHIGLDTINLNGKYFTPHVKVSDIVKQGQLIMEFDMEQLKKEGYDTVTPVNLCNSDDYSQVTALIHTEVHVGDIFMKLVK